MVWFKKILHIWLSLGKHLGHLVKVIRIIYFYRFRKLRTLGVKQGVNSVLLGDSPACDSPLKLRPPPLLAPMHLERELRHVICSTHLKISRYLYIACTLKPWAAILNTKRQLLHLHVPPRAVTLDVRMGWETVILVIKIERCYSVVCACSRTSCHPCIL